MSYRDIFEFIRENIPEDECTVCNDEMLRDLIREYIDAGFETKMFTKAKERIIKSILEEMKSEENLAFVYGIVPERWVFSRFDVDDVGINRNLYVDNRFKKKIERTLVFDMTASIRDYLRYSAYGKAA